MGMNMTVSLFLLVAGAQDKEPATTKQAMQAVQVLVGQWRVTAEDQNSKEKSWTEEHDWKFRINKDEYALTFIVAEGKLIKSGTLTYDLQRKLYRLELDRADGKKPVFEGKLASKTLVLDQVGEAGPDQERVTYSLFRDTRHMVSIEKRSGGAWLPTFVFGCTNKNLKFVRSEGPKCVVTGGTGVIEVAFEGKTYTVCCETCRDEFQRTPAKILENARKEGYIK